MTMIFIVIGKVVPDSVAANLLLLLAKNKEEEEADKALANIAREITTTVAAVHSSVPGAWLAMETGLIADAESNNPVIVYHSMLDARRSIKSIPTEEEDAPIDIPGFGI